MQWQAVNSSADSGIRRTSERSRLLRAPADNDRPARWLLRWALPLALLFAVGGGELRSQEPARSPLLSQTQVGPQPPGG
jgi:hypothetical protein